MSWIELKLWLSVASCHTKVLFDVLSSTSGGYSLSIRVSGSSGLGIYS
jgi:hypothetical protein